MLGTRYNFRTAIWKRHGAAGRVAWLALQPAAGLFAAGVALRNLCYRLGVLRSENVGIAVVSVGNLTVGGTGKTPVTLWLAERLRERGWRPAIVLRGYAGKTREITVVSRGRGLEAGVEQVGDEAAMLAKSFSGVVVTARRRAAGARTARALGCNLVLLDDGFQHRALARDFDLVLVGHDNGAPLPAGPMREGWRALRRADAVALVTKSHRTPPPRERVPNLLPSFAVLFESVALTESDGGQWRELPLAGLAGRRVAIVAGIADPEPFYAAVREWVADIVEVFEFSDHHRYTLADWQSINRDARDAEFVVTTEKDLIKLERFPFERGKLVALRVRPRVDGGDELLAMIERRLRQRSAAEAE